VSVEDKQMPAARSPRTHPYSVPGNIELDVMTATIDVAKVVGDTHHLISAMQSLHARICVIATWPVVTHCRETIHVQSVASAQLSIFASLRHLITNLKTLKKTDVNKENGVK